MNSLDLVLLLIMTVSIALSALRGGIRELFSLGAIIAAFILASNSYHFTSNTILRLTSHQEVNDIISFLAIFIFTAVLISFIGGHLTSAVKKSKLNSLNVLAGTAIGAIKGVVISCLIVYALMVFLPAGNQSLTGSRAFPYISRVSSLVSPIASRFFQDEFARKLKDFRSGKSVAPELKTPGEKPPEMKKPEAKKTEAAPAKKHAAPPAAKK